jgi:long-chain acyl-CoA synthetase
MAVREFKGWYKPKVKHFGDTSWRTFAQVGTDAHKFGAALRARGMVAAPDKTTLDKIKTPCSIAIFENTSAEWMISAIGAFSQGMIVTTVYATLGMEAVIEAINEVSITAIVCNKTNVGNLVDNIGKMKSLKTIVYTNDSVAPDDKIDLPKPPRGVVISSFDDFVASGDTAAFPPTPPKSGTCAVIMYTSGSTGKPKGVVITHTELVAAIAAGEISLGIRPGEDVYLGYLPLAHIMELMAEFVMIALGCSICYSDPKSLSSKGSYPLGALEQYSPTLMVAVPKIWDTIKKGIEAKVHASSPIAQFLVETAFQARGFALKHGYDTPLFNALVFKKFKKGVGGKLRFAISGGGPLNAQVQDFCRTAFGIDLSQGYGLTETCAGGTIQFPDDLRTGIAGVPIPSVEIKMESTPEVMDKNGNPYLSTDTEDVDGNPVFGRGEILIKGTQISKGYYLMPDKTKEVFRDDGFFETGDIGQFMSDGSVRIVDRKKNLVKLKGGEYIALEKMEMTYGNSSFVDAVAGGICCVGDGEMDRPVALMQLNEEYTMKWAKENGMSGGFEEIKMSQELYDAVLADFKEQHAAEGLSHLEKLVGVAFLTEHWTPDNGCLTAANKLQRRAVVQKFADEYEKVRVKGIF